MNIRPYVLCSFDYDCVISNESGSVYGYFTGHCDSSGKYTFIHLRDLEEVAGALTIAHHRDDDGVLQCRVKLPELRVTYYFFAPEIGEIHYQDEVLNARRELHEEREGYEEGVYADDRRRYGSDDSADDCEGCGVRFTTKDIGGGRCISCGRMIT